LFGWQRESLVGTTLEQLVPGHGRAQRPQLARPRPVGAIERRTRGTREPLYAMRKDGAAVPIELGLTPVETADGRMTLASIINIAERKLAEAEILRTREQLRQLAGHLAGAKEQERASIAREIHDELGALLTAAKIEVTRLADLLPPERLDLTSIAGSVDELVDQAMDLGRRISRRLRPAVLDHGIVPALDWQARDFAKRLGVSCEFVADDEDVELEQEHATAVFRVFQEALTNIARHAHANRVRVELMTMDGPFVTLRVTDDGVGIRPGDAEKSSSFGIRSMRERANYLGGELRVETAPGGGTELTLIFPHAGNRRESNVTQLNLEH